MITSNYRTLFTIEIGGKKKLAYKSKLHLQKLNIGTFNLRCLTPKCYYIESDILDHIFNIQCIFLATNFTVILSDGQIYMRHYYGPYKNIKMPNHGNITKLREYNIEKLCIYSESGHVYRIDANYNVELVDIDYSLYKITDFDPEKEIYLTDTNCLYRASSCESSDTVSDSHNINNLIHENVKLIIANSNIFIDLYNNIFSYDGDGNCRLLSNNGNDNNCQILSNNCVIDFEFGVKISNIIFIVDINGNLYTFDIDNNRDRIELRQLWHDDEYILDVSYNHNLIAITRSDGKIYYLRFNNKNKLKIKDSVNLTHQKSLLKSARKV